ncbi:MAG: hypothetical protein ACK4YP_05075 [Myxococcota bacterium]
MSSVSALFGAATRLASAGRRGDLSPSVDVSAGAQGLPAQTTMIVGGEDPALAKDPVLAAWFARIVGMITSDTFDVADAGRLGNKPVWPILAEGEGTLDTAALVGAVPSATAWVVALHPERFFLQAATRLEARGDARGADWAARLRTPTGNLALLGRVVRTVAIALQVGPSAGNAGGSVLRMRVTCPDEGSARQAVVALHGWRVRRGMADGPEGAAFRASDLVRNGTRVELSLPGDVTTLTGLFGRR